MAGASPDATVSVPVVSRPRPGNRLLWRRVVVLVAAATYLWVLVCLALWVLGPMVGFRWQPVMIDAGSMTPAINPGDVVLVDTDADVHDLGPGTVITFEDPGWNDLLVTHRIVQQLDDGAYRTRGDGSAVADSTSIQPEAILGSGRLLVPFIGLPMLWVDQDPTAAGVWVLMTLTAWVVVARVKELARPLTSADADAVSAGTSARRRPRGRIARAARRVSGGPAPIAGPVRRWGPTTLSAVTAGLLAAELGPVVIAWPLFILLVDPCGPHLPIGRWHRRWREGRVTRRLAPAPLGGTALSVVMVVVTLASTATFVAASANPTNSFAAATLAPPTNLTATQSCSGTTPTVTLDWTPTTSPGADGYTLTRNATDLGPVTPGTASSFTDTGTANNTAYTWTLTTVDGGWTSNPATVSPTTNCSVPLSPVVAQNAFGEYPMTVPGHVQAGDLLVVFLGADEHQNHSAPAGWTLHRSKDAFASNQFVRLWYRIATAGDAGTPQTFTVQTSGQTTTLGGLANGGTVEVVIPPTYPAGAQLAIQTTSTITVDGNGQTTTVSEVVSIQCTGNCDGTPVLFRMNLQSVIGFTDFSCAALQLADDCQAFFVTGLDSAASLGTSNGYHAISFGIVTGETAPASGPEQAAPTAVLARILPGGIIEGDLPPGNWGIEFQAPPADVGPGQVTTPAPADTGMGAATESGATDTMAIVLGLVALAGILGVGARFALARRQA